MTILTTTNDKHFATRSTVTGLRWPCFCACGVASWVAVELVPVNVRRSTKANSVTELTKQQGLRIPHATYIRCSLLFLHGERVWALGTLGFSPDGFLNRLGITSTYALLRFASLLLGRNPGTRCSVTTLAFHCSGFGLQKAPLTL